MKHRFYTWAVSLFLIFGLLLTGLALPVFAVPASDVNNSSNTPISNDELFVPDDAVSQSDDTAIIKDGKISQHANNISKESGDLYLTESTIMDGDSFDDAEQVFLNMNYTVNIDTPYSAKCLKFIPLATGFYTFESSSILSGDPKVRLYNAFQEELAFDDDGASNYNFQLTYHLISGATYYIAAGCFSNQTGVYDFTVTQATSLSRIGSSAVFTLYFGSSSSVSLGTPYKPQYYKFTPSVSGKYIFISADSTGHPRVWCYDSSSTLVGTNYNGAGNNNFKLHVELSSEETYYFVASHFSSQTGNYSIESYRYLSYVNYYDSSFATNGFLRSNIATANTFADYVYSNYFSIKTSTAGYTRQYATVLDDCTTGTNQQCTTATCGAECNNGHHKNIVTISTQIYNSSRLDNTLYVLWTNRPYNTTYCYEYGSGSHQPFSAIACVVNKRPVIHFLNIYGNNSNVQLACMALNLVHETAHTLRMNDVYDNIGHDYDGGTICVMERFDVSDAYDFYQDILAGIAEPFCASCQETLGELATTAIISGNQ